MAASCQIEFVSSQLAECHNWSWFPNKGGGATIKEATREFTKARKGGGSQKPFQQGNWKETRRETKMVLPVQEEGRVRGGEREGERKINQEDSARCPVNILHQ